jgi:hypothetical protein
MKPVARAIVASIVILAGVAVSGTALAHSSVHFGFGFGFPGYWYGPPAPYYSPPAYPYYNPYAYPAYGYPAAPATYVEQAAPPPTPAQPQGQWWYYCADAQAYYPYVRECAGGWQRVAPTPPGG